MHKTHLEKFSVTVTMPYVSVPKDLSRVKSKIALGLTKRQLVCFSIAAGIGVPAYILTRKTIGSEASILLMIGLMLPFFFMAMYERDGQPAEKIARNIIRARIVRSGTRPYKTENFYRIIHEEGKAFAKDSSKSKAKGEASGSAGKKPCNSRKTTKAK